MDTVPSTVVKINRIDTITMPSSLLNRGDDHVHHCPPSVAYRSKLVTSIILCICLPTFHIKRLCIINRYQHVLLPRSQNFIFQIHLLTFGNAQGRALQMDQGNATTYCVVNAPAVLTYPPGSGAAPAMTNVNSGCCTSSTSKSKALHTSGELITMYGSPFAGVV